LPCDKAFIYPYLFHTAVPGDQVQCKNVTILIDDAAALIASFPSGILMGEWRDKNVASYRTGDWLASRRAGRKALPCRLTLNNRFPGKAVEPG
jgi:hypothetical protein